ncbi:putative undecaprenyl-phosphate N-acetylgalactosaminyl 1-phosphate transferase [Clostridium sp. N3C]|nr:putative undecaprenyl-phosphate N-acetylgalactosaminyl 1-phosphate transferase [Clostridium sp. N3C]
MEEATLEKLEEEYILDIKWEKGIAYFAVKRFIDLFLSILGIIILSPIMLITAIAIKIDSKGPVFFSQQRVGKDGKLFKMYKFRSMVVDAEKLKEKLMDKNEMSGPMFKMTNDPRITRVGKLIRKTSVDELPQLFNVIKGDMSLVGPRPNLPKEVEQFSKYHKLKLLAKLGLTCYWQVMGGTVLVLRNG